MDANPVAILSGGRQPRKAAQIPRPIKLKPQSTNKGSSSHRGGNLSENPVPYPKSSAKERSSSNQSLVKNLSNSGPHFPKEGCQSNPIHGDVFGKTANQVILTDVKVTHNTQADAKSSSKDIEIIENLTLPTIDNLEELMDNEMYEESVSLTDDEFIKVKCKKQKRYSNGEVVSSVNQKSNDVNSNYIDTVSSNKYSILGTLDIESENLSYNHAFNNENMGNPVLPTKQKIMTENAFCPPIFLRNVNIKSLIDQLKSKNVIFKIQNKSKNKSKLYLKDAKVHAEMMQLMREKGIDSYSYTPREFKRQTVVCRGLYFKSDLNEIKDDVEKIVPDTIESISKFTTDYSRRNGIDTSLFLFTLKPNRNLNEILGIKVILSQVVSWERPKSSLKIPQCWRCQNWGHYSKNCNRPFACVKCDQRHPPGECSVTGRDESPFCVNCGKKVILLIIEDARHIKIL